MEAIFIIIVLIFSIVVHEVSHGIMAYWLGDTTAKDMGRLTLNPLPHLDPIGSVLVPLVLFLSQTGLIIGWAKPVPYNPYNLRNKRWGPAMVGAAGPLSNILIAVILGILVRLGVLGAFSFAPALSAFVGMVVFINLLLAVFNLVPIPPLDGSKLLFALLPPGTEGFQMALERYGFLLLLLFFLFGFGIIYAVLTPLFELVTGVDLLRFLGQWGSVF